MIFPLHFCYTNETVLLADAYLPIEYDAFQFIRYREIKVEDSQREERDDQTDGNVKQYAAGITFTTEAEVKGHTMATLAVSTEES